MRITAKNYKSKLVFYADFMTIANAIREASKDKSSLCNLCCIPSGAHLMSRFNCLITSAALPGCHAPSQVGNTQQFYGELTAGNLESVYDLPHSPQSVEAAIALK